MAHTCSGMTQSMFRTLFCSCDHTFLLFFFFTSLLPRKFLPSSFFSSRTQDTLNFLTLCEDRFRDLKKKTQFFNHFSFHEGVLCMSSSRLVSCLLSSGLDRFVSVLTKSGFNDENAFLLCVEDLQKMRITNKNEQQLLIKCAQSLHSMKRTSSSAFQANMNPTAGDCCRQAQTFLEHNREDRLWPRPTSLLANTIGLTPRPPAHNHGDQSLHCTTCASHCFSLQGVQASLKCKLSRHACCDFQAQRNGDEGSLQLRHSIISAELFALLDAEPVCRGALAAAEADEFFCLMNHAERIRFAAFCSELNRVESLARLELELEAQRQLGHFLSEVELRRAADNLAAASLRQVAAVAMRRIEQLMDGEELERQRLVEAECSCSDDFSRTAQHLRKCWERYLSSRQKIKQTHENASLRTERSCVKCHNTNCDFFRHQWQAHWSHRQTHAAACIESTTIGELFKSVQESAAKRSRDPRKPQSASSVSQRLYKISKVSQAATPAPPATPSTRRFSLRNNS